MSSKDEKSALDRRGFLRGLGGGAAGVATVAVAGTALPPAAAASESAADRKKKRYQADSANVQAFYRTNRY